MSELAVDDVVPVLRELAATLASIRDELTHQDPNRWDTLRNESQKALTKELQEQRLISRALVAVLGDVRDELRLFRTELRYIRETADRDARYDHALATGGGG